MVENQFEVIWNSMAQKQLRAIFEYIQKDSLSNAQKVVNDILISSEKLNINPERHGLDKLKINNDGSYRYFEIYRYRVAFRIYKNHVRILRVRNTYQEPYLY